MTTTGSKAQPLGRPPFLEELARARVFQLDGGIGTELYNRGFYLNQCYDVLNLSAADAVLDIHRSYAAAGAQVLGQQPGLGGFAGTVNAFEADEKAGARHRLSSGQARRSA